jgi:peptidoglycan hydrolase CwlO-like protein
LLFIAKKRYNIIVGANVLLLRKIKYGGNLLKKKLITLFAIIALMALIVIPLTGCSGEPAETENPLVELQNDFDELSAEFDSELANIKTRLSTLETSSVSSTINNKIYSLEANYSSLLSQINELKTGGNIDLTEIENNISVIDNGLIDVNSDLTSVKSEITEIAIEIKTLSSKIEGIENDCGVYYEWLEELSTKIITISQEFQDCSDRLSNIEEDIEENAILLNNIVKDGGYLDSMQEQIDMVEALALGKVSIYEYGDTYINFKINSGGNYAIVVTLYGAGLDGVTITNTNNIEVISEYVYGTDKTMKVIIIEPKQVGTPPVDANWATNLTFSLYITSGASNIQYVEVDTANR